MLQDNKKMETEYFLSLQLSLSETTDSVERIELIHEYLNNVDAEKNPNNVEFEGLEWINTEGPLLWQTHFEGKLLVLDFFTYCCINCMHVFPDLDALEKDYSIAAGLVVIGVHSAKFSNEKSTANILSAILRYDIQHPVVNDNNLEIWKKYSIKCWPSFLILGPRGQVLFLVEGEGHKEQLFEFVQIALNFYERKGEISHHNIPIKLYKESLSSVSPLLFPGKVCTSADGKIVVIADTGHNRILVLNGHGVVQTCIGTKEKGFCDGSFADARFHSPQGVAVLDNDVIFVADTENHAIRKIILSSKHVVTVAGTGNQGYDYEGGKVGCDQSLSSPWDIVIGSTKGSDAADLLYIAMAGTHQIWALFLQPGTWGKQCHHVTGTCIRIAGSGQEENRNNNYPEKSAFAQPSGLAISQHENFFTLYIADSESSSVRQMSLKTGAVKRLAGGEIDPLNLFAYGDVDGKGVVAKLQHCLGVSLVTDDHGPLLVADSYNHKIKSVDLATSHCSTLLGSGQPGDRISTDLLDVQLNEPGGLCVDQKNKLLYIADTNNHYVKVLDLLSNKLTQFPVIFPSQVDLTVPEKSSHLCLTPLGTPIDELPEITMSSGATLTVHIHILWREGLHLTEGARSAWRVYTQDRSPQTILDKATEDGVVLISTKNETLSMTFTLPDKCSVMMSEFCFYIEVMLYYCDDTGLCRMQANVFKQTIIIQEEVMTQCESIDVDVAIR